jgi:hypothetical protein
MRASWPGSRALRFQTVRLPYMRAYAVSNGYLTLLSDGERLTGAHALGRPAAHPEPLMPRSEVSQVR